MKNSKLFALGLFALLAALFLVGSTFAGGGDPRPVLRAVPAQSTWIADGVTQYKILLTADSTPMNGQNTRGIQAVYSFPDIQGYHFNVTSVNTHPSNDFFANYTTSPLVGDGGVWRGVTSGNGPSSATGTFVELSVTVSQTGPSVSDSQASLLFDGDPELTYFRRPIAQGGNIAPILESVSFTVEPRFRSVTAHKALFVCGPQDC